MKAEKLREMDVVDLEKSLLEWDEQMHGLKFRMTLGQTEGLKKLRELKKDRARALTILQERKKK
jgi:large subunit ribosomal protein L29